MSSSPLNTLAARLETITALDGPAGAISGLVNTVVQGPAKSLLSGAWLGHALHPLVTDVPIGAWTSAVILDWTGGRESRAAADRLILTGVLAAGAAGATGWSDWADAEGDSAAVRRSGLVHAAMNGTAATLMIGSYRARARGARGRGKLLALAGSAALGAGGWLGGHLSYTLGSGVSAQAPATGRQAAA